MAKKNPHYINKQEMNNEWFKSIEEGEPTTRLKELFWILCNRVCRSYGIMKKYKDANDVVDFVSEAFVQCCIKYDRFNLEKVNGVPNTFAYFSSVILNSNINFSKKLYPKMADGSGMLRLEYFDYLK